MGAEKAHFRVALTGGIARGVVFVPFNQKGLPPNTLLNGSFATPVTVEGGA